MGRMRQDGVLPHPGAGSATTGSSRERWRCIRLRKPSEQARAQKKKRRAKGGCGLSPHVAPASRASFVRRRPGGERRWERLARRVNRMGTRERSCDRKPPPSRAVPKEHGRRRRRPASRVLAHAGSRARPVLGRWRAQAPLRTGGGKCAVSPLRGAIRGGGSAPWREPLVSFAPRDPCSAGAQLSARPKAGQPAAHFGAARPGSRYSRQNSSMGRSSAELLAGENFSFRSHLTCPSAKAQLAPSLCQNIVPPQI